MFFKPPEKSNNRTKSFSFPIGPLRGNAEKKDQVLKQDVGVKSSSPENSLQHDNNHIMGDENKK